MPSDRFRLIQEDGPEGPRRDIAISDSLEEIREVLELKTGFLYEEDD